MTLGVLAVLLLLPGCTTVLLWDWAGEQETPGELLGMLVDDQRGHLVVYEYADTAGYEGGTRWIRIPPDWRELPVHTLATSPVGDALELEEPLLPVADEPLAPTNSDLRPLRRIDYRRTIGPVSADLEPDEYSYGFVMLIDDAGVVVHELYGYDASRAHWIRLTSVELGAYTADSGRVTAGVLLTPVTVVADLAILAAIACAISGGGNVGSLDFPSGGGSSAPQPVPFRDRARYWQGLSSAVPSR